MKMGTPTPISIHCIVLLLLPSIGFGDLLVCGDCLVVAVEYDGMIGQKTVSDLQLTLISAI